MPAVKTILVPIDFSGTSTRVLDYGRMLADACGASVHLLHVVADPLAPASTIDEERRDACRRLNGMLDSTDRDKRHATASCAVGTPASVIVDYATQHATDLIVMGTHWHGPTFHMATGSIAERVLGSAPCAVLAVKGAEPGADAREFDPPAMAT